MFWVLSRSGVADNARVTRCSAPPAAKSGPGPLPFQSSASPLPPASCPPPAWLPSNLPRIFASPNLLAASRHQGSRSLPPSHRSICQNFDLTSSTHPTSALPFVCDLLISFASIASPHIRFSVLDNSLPGCSFWLNCDTLRLCLFFTERKTERLPPSIHSIQPPIPRVLKRESTTGFFLSLSPSNSIKVARFHIDFDEALTPVSSRRAVSRPRLRPAPRD